MSDLLNTKLLTRGSIEFSEDRLILTLTLEETVITYRVSVGLDLHLTLYVKLDGFIVDSGTLYKQKEIKHLQEFWSTADTLRRQRETVVFNKRRQKAQKLYDQLLK